MHRIGVQQKIKTVMICRQILKGFFIISPRNIYYHESLTIPLSQKQERERIAQLRIVFI